MNNGVRDLPDMNELLRMAQEAQTKLMQAQADLDKVEVEGASGGGLVRVRASAKGRIIAVTIDESLLSPGEKQMVEDLVAAAINDARAKADVAAAEAMRDATGGLQLPPGFEMPSF
jgi:nucleoid-associated protein EbfC